MNKTSLPYRLLTPGPVPMAPEVLNALAEPVRHHRTPEFSAVLTRVWKGLEWFFGTRQPVLLLTSTGTGAMEAALVNTLSPGDEVLAIICGKFGERWAEMAERYGLHVHRLNIPWGQALDLDRLQTALRDHSEVKAVLTQAVETSTATLLPVREIAVMVQRHSQALLLVDGITGLGAMDLAMDALGIDVLIGGSQKALMLPTGLSFIALSERAWKASTEAKLPRYYFDLAAERAANTKGQTYFSSANSHIVALDVVLKIFQARGRPWLQTRCELLAEATRAAASALGLDIYSAAPAPSVTALRVPEGVLGAKLRDHLESHYNVTVMGGQDQLLGKILRFGHLGYITDSDALAGHEYLGKSLADLGWPGATAARQSESLKVFQAALARGPHVP